MAEEITAAVSATLVKGPLKAGLTGNDKFDMTGNHYVQQVQTIGASEEQVSKLDIGTLGFCAFKNVGTTGIISIGGATGAYVIELSPGEFSGPVRWSTNAIYAVGDVAGCLLEMLLLEA